MRYAILLLALSALCAGCSTVPTQPYSKAPPAPDGFGTIYIYRITAYPPTRSPDVSISDVKVAEPADKTYTWAYVKQGETRVSIEWGFDLGYTPANLKLNVAAGQSYFVKVAGSWQPGFGNTVEMNAWAETVSPATAEGELARCCSFVKPASVLVE